MRNKPNRDPRPQINFEVHAQLKADFNGKVKGKGLNSKDVLTRYVEAFLAESPAALQIALGEIDPHATTLATSPEVPEESPQNSAPGRTGNTTRGATIIEPTEYSEWLEMLEAILKSGNAVAIEAIVRNLHAFHVLIHSTQGSADAGYPVPTAKDLEKEANITAAIKRYKRTDKSPDKRARRIDRRAG